MAAKNRCLAGLYWNGSACVAPLNDCAWYASRAAGLSNELRRLRAEMENACAADPGGEECSELKRRYPEMVQRYGTIGRGPMVCANRLYDPLAFDLMSFDPLSFDPMPF